MNDQKNNAITKYGKSTVPMMDHFETIMNKYNAIGKSMSVRAFHAEHVKLINPQITLRMWQNFMTKFNRQVVIKAEKIIKLSEDKAVNDMTLEERGMRKVLAIANISLEEVIQKPELLAQIPMGDRMKWFFQSMKSRDSRIGALVKKRDDDRKQTSYDELMTQAQYGGVDYDDIPAEHKPAPKIDQIEPEEVEPEVEEKPQNTVVFAQKAPATVEFKPEDL